MTALPAALAPWRQWLEWFAPEIAAVVGDLLLRLDPLLGRRMTRLQRGALDPDGIDDLRRRGSYERLLLSEWALADEAPDEFVRRAASNEHLFLAPRLVARRSDARLVALFDAGPAQLGAPRLVHVALWILLARRAQAARAQFAWGVAQRPGTLHDADSPERLQQLLLARSLRPPTPDDWLEWNAAFAAAPPSGERWLLAGAEAGTTFTHSALIRRGFEPGIAVSIGTPQARRHATLALPSSAYAARLLRGQFQAAASPDAHRRLPATQRLGMKLSLRVPPLISADGHHIAVPLLGTSGAVVVSVSRPELRKSAKPRYHQWTRGTELFCAMLTGKQLGGVIATTSQLRFWQLPGFGLKPRPQPSTFTLTPGRARWLPCASLSGSRWTGNVATKQRHFYCIDDAGRLLRWSEGAPGAGGDPATLETDVAVLHQANEHDLAYASASADAVRIVQITNGGTFTAAVLAASGRPAAVWMCGRMRNGAWRGTVCVETRAGERGRDRACRFYAIDGRMQSPGPQHELAVAGDVKVLGLVDADTDDGARLLTLRGDARTLVAIGARAAETLYVAPADVTAASVSANGRVVALLTLGGRLTVLIDGGRTLAMCVGGSDADEETPHG